VIPIKMFHLRALATSCRDLFHRGAYFVCFMLTVALLKTAAHEDITPGKSEFYGCSIYDEECERTWLSDKAALLAI